MSMCKFLLLMSLCLYLKEKKSKWQDFLSTKGKIKAFLSPLEELHLLDAFHGFVLPYDSCELLHWRGSGRKFILQDKNLISGKGWQNMGKRKRKFYILDISKIDKETQRSWFEYIMLDTLGLHVLWCEGLFIS